MRFSLQDMVRKTLAEAEMREKTAQAEEEICPECKNAKGECTCPPKKKEAPPASDSSGSTSPERNEESLEEKTSSVFVEKLASAVAYCNTHFIKIAVGEPEPAPVAKPKTTTAGPGIGATSLSNTIDSPTAGMQSTNTGQAKSNQPPLVPGSDVTSPGQVNPATALETDINSPPGGSEDWSEGADKMKQAQVLRVRRIMAKMAADTPPDATASGEGVPSQPGEVSKQESMIGSNEAAQNYEKQQAKAVPTARMGEVLSEPAQKKSTDPVLHENLDAASGAGVKLSSVEKVAAARSLLQKIAEEGAKEDASPEEKEKALKLQEILKAKQQEKEACGIKQGSSMPLSGGY